MPVKADNLWIRGQAVSEGAKCMANYMYTKKQAVAKSSVWCQNILQNLSVSTGV